MLLIFQPNLNIVESIPHKSLLIHIQSVIDQVVYLISTESQNLLNYLVRCMPKGFPMRPHPEVTSFLPPL